MILAILLALNGIALAQFWHSPAHQPDDHRSAVSTLAADWRPGDLILVNSGWTYTALETYWPSALNNAQNSLPAQLDQRQRLTDYLADDPTAALPAQPLLLYTGTIDGDPNLGWGSSQSDFYAISEAEMQSALSNLAKHYSRIWHYRLYDTNSDPDGAIRNWLGQNSTQLDDRLYSGPASLRVQLFETGTEQSVTEADRSPVDVEFGNALIFDYAQFASPVHAGQTLYLATNWTPLPELALLPANLRLSLRLYADQDDLVAQLDQSPMPPTSAWTNPIAQQQSLALPIPVGTAPGNYSLELVVYREDTGEALSVPESEQSVYGQRLRVGTVAILATDLPIRTASHMATFDYIDLLNVKVNRTEVARDETFQMEVTWLPSPNQYTDTYIAVYELRGKAAGDVILQTWREFIGGPTYPSGQWIAGAPVNERRSLTVDPQVAPGTYHLTLRLERSSDELPIDARVGWRSKAAIELAEITIK